MENENMKRLFWASLIGVAVLLLILSVETSGATEIKVSVAPSDASTVLPTLSGTHAVGVRSFYWLDNTRSKTGLPGDGGNREISATVWYPAITKPGQQLALYSPGIEKILAAIDSVPEDKRQFIMAHDPLRNVASNSVPGAYPATAENGWPVIFFSPGGNVSHHFQTVLAEMLASQGFVFIAMSHPYSSLDFAAESGFSISLDWDLDNEDRQLADANDNRLAQILADDAAFVFDQVQAIATTDDPLAAAIDMNRAGIAGHSRGGKTVGRACSSKEIFRACVVIDNIGPARERVTGIDQPFLTLRSDWDAERVTELHDYLGRTGSIAHDVVLLNSNHFSCTDLPIFISELQGEGIEPVTSISACARIIASFFESFLSIGANGITDWLPDGLSDQISMRRFGSTAIE